jgi:hypothetical protein
MPRLLDYLSPAYAWLAATDPSLPRALFVALVFVTVLAWRKFWPLGWAKFSSVIPVSEADTSWFRATLQKLWQALPAAVLGAIYGALGTGGDVVATVKLALLGLAAPVIHEVAWRYQGKLGTPSGKLPPPGSGDSQPVAPAQPHVFLQNEDGSHIEMRSWPVPALGVLSVLACLVLPGLTGCGLFTAASAKTAQDIAHDLCVLHYGKQKPALSLEDVARTYCKNIDPWLDSLLGAEQLAAAKVKAAQP